MTLDAIAAEVHFLDHLAPVWLALPDGIRGRFLVEPSLVERATAAGLAAEPLDVDALRRTPQSGPRFDGRLALVSSIGDIKIGRRLGYGPYAFLEHGAGQAYDGKMATMASYSGGPDRADNELFMVPNDYSASRWWAAYPAARVEVVGCPKLDSLPRRDGGGPPVVAISFHGEWPHGVGYGGNALTDFHAALPELRDAFTLIGHAHPGRDWGARMARIYAKLRIPYVAAFDDVCRQADVYVCDNSSTIFEFAATGRPVVLLNAKRWHRKGGPGLRFWDAAHVGLNVDRPEALIDTVSMALEDPPDVVAAREDALRFVYQPSLTGAAGRASAAVVAWLRGRAVVAA